MEKNEIYENTVMMEALKAAAEDVVAEEGRMEITTSPEQCEEVKDAMEQKEYVLERMDFTMMPSTTVDLIGETFNILMLFTLMLKHNDARTGSCCCHDCCHG
ncbi:YebC/PmpR family DNA-binding transcriptional regulator [Longirhabdus pacifica]|uniref:YebC/PmpR family DNA-binding transcriptional regulator n=1 Tax=Longirhabdus pacifica TaxID=2305227 RepID=UPI0010090DB5|nr:YebC/PmpR family DNA-binding transcriptional regulator [Longirhabdus pacifica]